MFEGMTFVKVKCMECGVEGEQPTFQKFLDNPESPISKMIEKFGHVPSTCMDCQSDEEEENEIV